MHIFDLLFYAWVHSLPLTCCLEYQVQMPLHYSPAEFQWPVIYTKSGYLQDYNCIGICDFLADKSKFDMRMSGSLAYPEKKSTITNILRTYTSSCRMWIDSSNSNPTCITSHYFHSASPQQEWMARFLLFPSVYNPHFITSIVSAGLEYRVGILLISFPWSPQLHTKTWPAFSATFISTMTYTRNNIVSWALCCLQGHHMPMDQDSSSICPCMLCLWGFNTHFLAAMWTRILVFQFWGPRLY
jgi:hypothetical protein